MKNRLPFIKESVFADFIAPSGDSIKKEIEIRTNPITGRTSRIAFARVDEKEIGTDFFPEPPPEALSTENCPFCESNLHSRTPKLRDQFNTDSKLTYGKSTLFPNLFPYGSYSAVSLFNNQHFVEIGKATADSYKDCFINCNHYLKKILKLDPGYHYMAITQNHLPSAGGSLMHPHLQVNADCIPSNHQRFMQIKANEYLQSHGSFLFSDYLSLEQKDGSRMIGTTGNWNWLAAFAPEGFFEIWGILPGVVSLKKIRETDWEALSQGVTNIQKFYRSLNRNGYNLGILFNEDNQSKQEIRITILVRSNYTPWARNDHTGFEVILGDMATFTSPEETALKAKPFFV